MNGDPVWLELSEAVLAVMVVICPDSCWDWFGVEDPIEVGGGVVTGMLNVAIDRDFVEVEVILSSFVRLLITCCTNCGTGSA